MKDVLFRTQLVTGDVNLTVVAGLSRRSAGLEAALLKDPSFQTSKDTRVTSTDVVMLCDARRECVSDPSLARQKVHANNSLVRLRAKLFETTAAPPDSGRSPHTHPPALAAKVT